ncbi:MAG: ABC transporter permease, partial [Acidimicrobiia bacterium]|nr:ABC transporter permease [Acidimicrobiia bacterium]
MSATRIVKAELFRLARRRTLVVATVGSLVFAALTSLTVFSSAQAAGVPSRRGGTTLAALAGDGGGTEAFAVGASFVGFFVFVTFIALLATEFSGGTFRALLLRDPHRLRVIVGKLVGILVVAAGVVALTEVFTFVVSLLVAPGQ